MQTYQQSHTKGDINVCTKCHGNRQASMRHFTQNHKCESHDETMLWTTVPYLTANYPIVFKILH